MKTFILEVLGTNLGWGTDFPEETTASFNIH
jgi:hypothetical protein